MADQPIDGLPYDAVKPGLFGGPKLTPRHKQLLMMYETLSPAARLSLIHLLKSGDMIPAHQIENFWNSEQRGRTAPPILGVRASFRDTTGSDLA